MAFPLTFFRHLMRELDMTEQKKTEQILKFQNEYEHLSYHELGEEFSRMTAEIRSKWNTDSFETTTDKTRQAEMMNLILRRIALFANSKGKIEHVLTDAQKSVLPV